MRYRRILKLTAKVCFAAWLAALSVSAQKSAELSTLRPEGPCDIYGAAGDPCVGAHSTTRALYRAYNGPLYQVLRQTDGKTLDILAVRAGTTSGHDRGGYADAKAQDDFCANTYCFISRIYDQSPKHNDLTQAPRGGFSGPALGGMNNLPLADMAPITIMGHKVYGVFIAPGTGLRNNDPRGTAVDDQAEGQYWVINGHHFNGGCCYDYGNAEIDSRDDDNGTMETAYFGNTTGWIHGNPPGPWIETDQENNLVGCVNTDESRLCAHLPDIHWRFVTAMAKGEPHHWASLGGDAQRGRLTVMFDGQRVNSSYDPMRKQGAILLGNGGDNSNSSQGTFYEGAVTASGTFPTDATDQLVQANVVAAGYDVQRLSLQPAAAKNPTGVQTFSPGASQKTVVTFTNISKSPVNNVVLGLRLPGTQWTAAAEETQKPEASIAGVIAPGGSAKATFLVKAGSSAVNGDLVAVARWKGSRGEQQSERQAMKVRSTAPVRINAFRIASGSNSTDTFVELYNDGSSAVDLSGWSLTARPTQQAVFSGVKVPVGTTLQPKSFYVFGLAHSGLSASAGSGESVLHVRSVAGLSSGSTVVVGTGIDAESRKVAAVGSAASDPTTVWQPQPDGEIRLPAGSTNVPVQSVAGFKIGEKVAIGYGPAASFVDAGLEQFEVATVTKVGKPGTQAYLAEEARAGSTTLQVTATEDISVGDKIRLDIDSPGHGIEFVTITRVGTKANQTNLLENVNAGADQIRVRRADGFASGKRIVVGTPASKQTVTVTAVKRIEGGDGAEITVTPKLSGNHGRDEWVVSPGTGLDLATPLRFSHTANLPFSNRGTGITFEPATRFVHVSNEPVLALGSGIALASPLEKQHGIHAAVRNVKGSAAGYQAGKKTDQWFGGPELTTRYLQFGRMTSLQQGSLVLRDATGVIADSLNYGGLADLWAAKGYQAESGERKHGCFVAAPNAGGDNATNGGITVNRSASRVHDGLDTDSNCEDFLRQ